MRALLTILALLVLASAAYFVLQSESGEVAPPSGEQQQAPDQAKQPATPVVTERRGATPEPPRSDVPSPSEHAAKGSADSAPPGRSPDAAAITVILNVRNVVTMAPVPSLRWRYEQRDNMQRGEANGGLAELALARGTTGDLLVEADGMQPFTKKQLAILASPGQPQHLDILLTPTAKAAGITLIIKDLDRQPIPHVRVDVFQITEQNRNTAWQLARPMWARRTDAEHGVYELPPLPPGNYGLLLVATDAEGQLLPLQSYRQTFTLTGTNGFLEDVILEPGCALQLELLESNGQPFDPARHGTVTIALHLVGQQGMQRKWTAHTANNATVSEADRVPGKGTIWIDEPVEPGNYQLKIAINGSPRVQQSLNLRANQRQLERIYVR